jgi:hypothetical protein
VTCLRIKTVLYLSIICSGFLLGLVFPFAQVVGVSPSVLFIAFFKPYFGWKKTLLISFAVSAMVAAFTFTSLMGLAQVERSMFEGIVGYANNFASQYENTLGSRVQDFYLITNSVYAFPHEAVLIVGMILMRLLATVLCVFILKKTSVWRILQL